MIDPIEHEQIVASLRASSRDIAHDSPPLLEADVAGLLVFQAEMLLQPLLLRSVQLTSKLLAVVQTQAFLAVLDADDELVFRAGFWPRERCEMPQAIAHWKASYLPWHAAMSKLARAYEARPRERPEDPRESKLLDWYQPIMRQGTATKAQLQANIRSQLRRAQSEEESPLAVLATTVFLSEQEGKLDRLGWIDASGKATVDSDAIRDRYRPSRGQELDACALPPGIEDADAAAALSEIEQADLVACVRAVRAARLRRNAVPGSGRHAVLSTLLELSEGELTIADLARRCRLSESVLREAYALERESIRKRLVGES